MKAMGIESDQEIVQLVGQDPAYASLLAPTLEECQSLQLYTSQNALEWLGERLLHDAARLNCRQSQSAE